MISRIQFARTDYHAALITGGILRIIARDPHGESLPNAVPSNSDRDSATSVTIARLIFEQILAAIKLRGGSTRPRSGSTFERVTRSFINDASKNSPFLLLRRPESRAKTQTGFGVDPYPHGSNLKSRERDVAGPLGTDYVVTPDILVAHRVHTEIPLRLTVKQSRHIQPIPYASIACKWALRRRPEQTARSEAVSPLQTTGPKFRHVAVLTAEPLPSRLAVLALGTRDVDCVYHFALPELIRAVKNSNNEDSVNLVEIMIRAEHLKDVSELPLDLAHCAQEYMPAQTTVTAGYDRKS